MTCANTGSDNGLSPVWHQAIIWTNVSTLSIRHPGINFRVILSKIRQEVSFKLKMSFAKQQPFCLGLNVLKVAYWVPEHLHERHTYLFDCCELMHHTLIYRISEPVTLVLCHKWFEGLVKHCRGTEHCVSQRVFGMGQMEGPVHLGIVPSHLERKTGIESSILKAGTKWLIFTGTSVFSNAFSWMKITVS